MLGTGTGTQRAPAVQMCYNIKLEASAGGYVLNMIDWMYLMKNGPIMNRNPFRKFVIPVADPIATLRKLA